MSDENERSVASTGSVEPGVMLVGGWRVSDSTTPPAMPPASTGSVADRITAYLCSGGLFDPELGIHNRVRDLLIDAMAEIARLRLTDAEREAVEVVLRMCGDPSPVTAPLVFKYAATLRGLLDRACGADGRNRATGEK